MKFVVGSKSTRKIEIVKRTVEDIIKNPVEVFGLEAVSQVPETPWDKQTFDGARNRALFCKNSEETADYFIGLESGLVERYGHIYEEAWAICITNEEKEFAGYSSGLKVPDLVLDKMKELHFSHDEVMDILDKEKLSDLKHETWGNYTNGILLREMSLAEALRNAAVQIFSDTKSFYKRR